MPIISLGFLLGIKISTVYQKYELIHLKHITGENVKNKDIYLYFAKS